MGTTSPEYNLVEADTNRLRDLELQIKYRHTPVHNNIMTIDIILAVEDLLGSDCCLWNAHFGVLFQWLIELDLEA